KKPRRIRSPGRRAGHERAFGPGRDPEPWGRLRAWERLLLADEGRQKETEIDSRDQRVSPAPSLTPLTSRQGRRRSSFPRFRCRACSLPLGARYLERAPSGSRRTRYRSPSSPPGKSGRTAALSLAVLPESGRASHAETHLPALRLAGELAPLGPGRLAPF